jgi:hypothetical protein
MIYPEQAWRPRVSNTAHILSLFMVANLVPTLNLEPPLMALNALTMGGQSILMRPVSSFMGIPIGGTNSRLGSAVMEMVVT